VSCPSLNLTVPSPPGGLTFTHIFGWTPGMKKYSVAFVSFVSFASFRGATLERGARGEKVRKECVKSV
jgi:hypothetical protein